MESVLIVSRSFESINIALFSNLKLPTSSSAWHALITSCRVRRLHNTYATKPPRNATGPPPMSRIFLWQESNSDGRAWGGDEAWLCSPTTPPPPAPGPCPIRCAGERSIAFKRSRNLLNRKSVSSSVVVLAPLSPTRPTRTRAHKQPRTTL